MSSPAARAALRPPLVVDDLFDRAVERDIDGRASEADRELLEESPFLWRSCLAARFAFLCGVFGGAVETSWHEVLVEQKGSAMSSFRVRVRGLERAPLLRLKATIEARIQRAKVLQREVNQAENARKKARLPPRSSAEVGTMPQKVWMRRRVRVLEDLVMRASGMLPRDAPLQADIAEYVEIYRRGFALGNDGDEPDAEAP